MKTLLKVALTAAIISTTASAGWVFNTTVSQVNVDTSKVQVVFANPSGGNFSPKTLGGVTADDEKAMLATILTAKSTGANIDIYLTATSFSKVFLK